jgi:chlorobactene glucosyltransferase
MMELTITIVNWTSALIMFGIFGAWLYLFIYTIKSFRQSPILESFDQSTVNEFQKVSVILPARNEEKYVGKCLDSLLKQDYSNFEIIAINDSSSDRTEEIMHQYAVQSSNIIVINADPKPDGWVGKNWACYQGYLKASGEVFLFTDADTVHSPSVISMAIRHLEQQNLDALTAIPKLLCMDIWTKITLPVLSTFLHSRFSPLRVNDPKTKTGYFFGSFFVITRSSYETVGTHRSVRHELIEDGALGGKVKQAKFRMKMVRGEHHIDAIWARDIKTLWHGLRRLMIPLYSQNRRKVSLMTIALFFLLFEPFLLLPYSLSFLLNWAANDLFVQILFDINVVTIVLIILTNLIHSKFSLFQNPIYALASPLGCAIVSLSFISSVIGARKIGAVNWSDRQYTINEKQHPVN